MVRLRPQESTLKLTTLSKLRRRGKNSSAMVTSWTVKSRSVRRRLNAWRTLLTILRCVTQTIATNSSRELTVPTCNASRSWRTSAVESVRSSSANVVSFRPCRLTLTLRQENWWTLELRRMTLIGEIRRSGKVTRLLIKTLQQWAVESTDLISQKTPNLTMCAQSREKASTSLQSTWPSWLRSRAPNLNFCSMQSRKFSILV